MKKVLIILCLVSTFGYSQQLYRQTFSASVTTTQHGISMPGEAFNKVYTIDEITIGESILYMVFHQNPLSNNLVSHSEITIYPNPVRDKLYIKGIENSHTTVTLYDYSGKKIIQKPLLNDYLDTDNLSAGIYILELHNDENTFKQKIIKR